MRYVKQKGSDDCGIAALAMATGVDYDRIASDIPVPINQTDAEEWLRDHGFAWQIMYQMRRVERRFCKREHWPPAAWAPTHIAQVKATQELHFVALDRDGCVFDPWDRSRAFLTDPAYREVHWVMGLWPISNAPL